MAHDAIVEKLRRELRVSVRTERQVVYILVELRKLLEKSNKKEEYAVVNFYCNWAVHTKLEKSAIADKIVILVDDIHKVFSDKLPHVVVSTELSNLIGYIAFRDELKQCLEFFTLPSRLCTVTSRWLTFLRNLGGVIEDSPLLIRTRKLIQQPRIHSATIHDVR